MITCSSTTICKARSPASARSSRPNTAAPRGQGRGSPCSSKGCSARHDENCCQRPTGTQILKVHFDFSCACAFRDKKCTIESVLIARLKFILAIPGKACGECSFCCKVLEIAELAKSAGKLCDHCLNSGSGGCGIYAGRPQVCRDYECLWKGDRDMSPRLRPDRTGTILMEDPDSDEYRAVCDPEKPFAWLTPLVFKHLVAMAKNGRIVAPRSGLKSWPIRANGQWGPCV